MEEIKASNLFECSLDQIGERLWLARWPRRNRGLQTHVAELGGNAIACAFVRKPSTAKAVQMPR